jgi:hypothetical protein
MPETAQAQSGNTKKSEIQENVSRNDSLFQGAAIGFSIGLRRILIFGGTLITALLVVGVFAPYMSERIKFITVNALSILVLVAIAVQAYIYRRQWETMDRQWLVTRKMLEHDELVFEANQKQASQQMNAMQGQLEAMKEQIAVGKNQADIADTAVRIAERSAKAAEDGVKTAQENTIFAQRAYVCVTKANIQEGNLFTLHIENAGNTPANDVQMVCRAEVREEDPNPKLALYAPEQHHSAIGVIAPHAFIQKLKLIDGGFGAIQQKRMQAGWKLYCYGKIYYKDIFGNLRNTYFSFSQRWNNQVIGPCEQGNEAD